MEKLLTELLKQQAEIKDGLVDTPALSLESYHRRVGQHEGLQRAIDTVYELLKPRDEDDE